MSKPDLVMRVCTQRFYASMTKTSCEYVDIVFHAIIEFHASMYLNGSMRVCMCFMGYASMKRFYVMRVSSVTAPCEYVSKFRHASMVHPCEYCAQYIQASMSKFFYASMICHASMKGK